MNSSARRVMIAQIRNFSGSALLKLEKKVGDGSFKDIVLKSKMPVVVDFYADWCGPCRMISPILSKLAEKDDGFLLVKINVDEAPDSARDYSISALPTIVGFSGGKEVARFIGLKDEKGIQKFITGLK